MTDNIYLFAYSSSYLGATVEAWRWYIPAMTDFLCFTLVWGEGEKEKKPKLQSKCTDNTEIS